ncbi:glutamine--fructose-6-phosphate transaminase (isomerizing) [Ruminococcaceae bacterium OttesenSCG-928-I18]|nr:glutamine--fructose-6-phosphate transaminase (isomerizing) [Ruminococcaceae bacterium OttesenSCG-928-I18]
MCGIVGYIGQRESREVLLEGLKRLEYRGYDSAGVAFFEEGAITVYKSQGRLEKLAEKLNEANPSPCHMGIGHTRWATHGAPSDINSHPHSAARVSLVHNGIIENYGKLKEFLIHEGYTFLSQTDSEVLVNLLDYHYQGKKNPIEAITATLQQVHGSYALAILFGDQPGKVFAVRHESPLIVAYGKGENFLASDIPAILAYTRQYSVLENGDIAVLTKEAVTVYDEFGIETKRDILTADFSVEAAEKGGYPHFMLKEIHEQPAAINASIRPRIEDGLPNLGLQGLTDQYLKDLKRIYIVACGTAMHAGMVGKSAIEKMTRTPVEVDIASEFRYRNPIFSEGELVIIISQSGETIDTLAALRMAKERGAKTLAIVNAVGSSIARAADWVMYSYAGPEIAVASTKAYTVQLCCLYLFAMQLARVKGTLDDTIIRHLLGELLRVPEIIQPMLDDNEQVQFFASELMNTGDLFFLGRNIDYSLSLEGSLKLKEISYVHSEAYAAGELKHGTISLVVDGTPIIAIATQDEVFEKTISNIQEVKSRGAKVVLFCKEDAQVPEGTADYIYRLPCFEGVLMPLLLVVPLQLFAYYMSVLRGCDVDKPRNLAKSVTVE